LNAGKTPPKNDWGFYKKTIVNYEGGGVIPESKKRHNFLSYFVNQMISSIQMMLKIIMVSLYIFHN
jgi:hypothetical protein